MKNLFKGFLLILFVSLAVPSQSNIVGPAGVSQPMNAEEAQKIAERLEQINGMDPKTMTRQERKAARKEVRAIKKATAISGGVYLSVGAIIIIILLLIILL